MALWPIFILQANDQIDNLNDKSFHKKERKIALVIGNWNYIRGPLRNPESDSNAMAMSLTKLGFDVIYKKNLDRRNFRKAIREFGKQLNKYEVAIFYFPE